MSVLSNITEIHFINKTNYYIEIHFSGEQQSKITILQKSENVISKISNTIEYIYSYFMGEEIDLVKIKLLPKQKEYMLSTLTRLLHKENMGTLFKVIFAYKAKNSNFLGFK